MDFIQKERQENSPYIQLLMLAFYAFVGIILTFLLSGLIIWMMYGKVAFYDLNAFINDPKNLAVTRILVIVQQFGLFLFPALLLAKIEGKKINGFYGFKIPTPELMLLVFLILAFSMPVLEWTIGINQKMVLPDALKSVELWMKASEKQAMETTMAFLKMDDVWTYLLNMFMIAALPAVAEEFIFRGALQRSFGRMFKNPHVAIWVTAFIFSAIHLQFYGFLPRFLLGAGLGYIYFWTGSLWYSMFAHFLNNGYAVTAAWYMQKNNIPLTEADKTTNFAWYGYIISAILTTLIFLYFKNKALKDHGKQLG